MWLPVTTTRSGYESEGTYNTRIAGELRGVTMDQKNVYLASRTSPVELCDVLTADKELIHVKPHGAIYNQAAQDRELANSIARAVKRFSVDLVLVGLAGSRLIEAGLEVGLRVANEGFPDRNYNPDGTLVSRKESHAIIESPDEVAKHAMELIQNGILVGEKRVRVDTLCLHGDHPRVVENAKLIREIL